MKKVMLVDDVEISNFITRKVIEKVSATTEVVDFTLPEMAYESLGTIAPDVIFLDLNMPKIDGWKFLEMMKHDQRNTPVYILTSSTSELDLQRSRQYDNVKQLLVKPLTKDVLQHIISPQQIAAS